MIVPNPEVSAKGAFRSLCVAQYGGLTPSCGIGVCRFAGGWVGIALTACPATAYEANACAGVFLRATGVTAGYIL